MEKENIKVEEELKKALIESIIIKLKNGGYVSETEFNLFKYLNSMKKS